MDQEADRWFIVTTCEECQKIIYLMRDLNKGRGSLNAIYQVTCPFCQHRGSYEARHYRESEAARTSSGGGL
jgi:hypothetical protein